MDTPNENVQETYVPEEETLEIEAEDVGEVAESLSPEEIKALKKQVHLLQAQKEHFRKKAEKVADKPNTASDNVFTRDEAVLIAQGMDLDDLDNLKAIQKGTGVKTLKEALESPLFKAYSKEKKEEQKRKAASLGASGGTGRSSEIKPKPNMSEDEHRKFWATHYNK